jgi:hypothetical protein
MQYLLLIYDNEKRFSQGYRDAELDEYRAFGQEFARLCVTTNLTTDGPFAETKEQLGGYYLVEARDQEEALAIAAKIPGARYGSIEVRPSMTFS